MLLRAALLAAAIVLGPIGPALGVTAVPDEPDVFVLPDAPVLQAVAADLDANGSRELVRLVRGEGDAALAEAWGVGSEGWTLLADPVQVLAPARNGPRVDPVYAGVPLRLLVHRVGGVPGVVVASQPRFDEIDTGPACCLVLHRLVLEGGELRRVAVSQPTDPVGGILSIDLDGDDTDELLTSLSLPPVGDISYPVEARVYRWTGDGFAPPVQSDLPVGSGDSPIVIGDTDGRPGDEAAFISTLGPPGLFRLTHGPDDGLRIDRFGDVVSDAVGVPLPGGRGVAVDIGFSVVVREWPAFGEPGPVIASASVPDADLLGVVEIGAEPRLLVRDIQSSALHVLGLPDLQPVSGAITRSAAAGALAGLPTAPYVGPLPGGGPTGADTVVFEGRMLPSPEIEPFPLMGAAITATLAGATPVGLVAGGDWMAMLHVPRGPEPPAPGGGRFEMPTPLAEAWVSVAPLAVVRTPEVDGGLLEPRIEGIVELRGGRDVVFAGRTGFTAEIDAPPGSRVVATDLDPSVPGRPQVVPESGRLLMPVVPPPVVTPNPRYRAALVVLTPGGHGYVARWEVRVLTEPPALEASVSTPFGSPDVVVSGRAAPYATLTVNGSAVEVAEDGRFDVRVAAPPWPTDIAVVAADVAGNEARQVVSAVGYFDYRGLPWIPMVAALVAIAAVALYLRIPRPPITRRPAEPRDDAVLEEVESD